MYLVWFYMHTSTTSEDIGSRFAPKFSRLSVCLTIHAPTAHKLMFTVPWLPERDRGT
jgi:hypothetical protein